MNVERWRVVFEWQPVDGGNLELEGFRWCLLEYTGEEAIATKIVYDHDCIVNGNPICSFDLDTEVKHIKRGTY